MRILHLSQDTSLRTRVFLQWAIERAMRSAVVVCAAIATGPARGRTQSSACKSAAQRGVANRHEPSPPPTSGWWWWKDAGCFVHQRRDGGVERVERVDVHRAALPGRDRRHLRTADLSLAAPQ